MKVISHLFQSFELYKDRNAACIGDIYYSYAELFSRVSSIVKIIKTCNSDQKQKRIGVVCNDDIETYASLIACWFTTNAYVPINPLFPVDRNSLIINEAEVSLLLDSKGSYSEHFRASMPADFVYLTNQILQERFEFQLGEFDQNVELYILFTSGSTGVPKGVPINASNFQAFIDSFESLGIDVTKDDRVLQMFDLTFDVSVASFVIPLLKGACFYTINSEKIKYLEIYRVVKTHSITIATIVPSVINLLKPYIKEIKLSSVRYCILTAEASNVSLLNEFQSALPNAKIVNLYGPTEATIWCTGYFMDSDHIKQYNGMLAIGRPFKNVKTLIVDESNCVIGNEEKGELLVSGNQITAGYLNNEERNKIAFCLIDGTVYYKTGDLVFKDAKGDIFYCGRLDTQVKIQGYRIELSEIEVNVRRVFNVNNIAIAITDSFGVSSIALFIENKSFSYKEVKQELEKVLPVYMIPSKVIFVEEFPVNSSGKFDKLKLKELVDYD